MSTYPMLTAPWLPLLGWKPSPNFSARIGSVIDMIVLHDMEGYTGAEIAAMLEVPVNTVHSRLRLARADLVVAVRRLRGEP